MTNPYEPPRAPARLDKEHGGSDRDAYGAAPYGQSSDPARQGQWGAPSPAPGQYIAPRGWAPLPVERPEIVPTSALATPWVRLGAAALNVVLVIVTLFVGYLVWTLVLWNQGTNPGKKILGLVVVKADTGRVCTFGDMLVRNFVFGGIVMSVFGSVTVGIASVVDLFMIFGSRRQRLIDKMAGTLVVVAHP